MLADDPRLLTRKARARTPGPNQELYPAQRGARIRRWRGRCGPAAGLAIRFLALGSATLTLPAQAEPPPPATSLGPVSPAARPATASDPKHGQAHFEAGLEHYRARRYREAIREFELSLAEQPSAEVWFDLGRCHEQLGEYALAIDGYRKYLRDRVDAPDADEVRRRIETIEKQRDSARSSSRTHAPPSALAIDAAAPGVIVLLDGEQVGKGPFDQIVGVTPGRHRIDASRAGYAPFRAEIDVQPGALSAAYVELQPLSRPRDVPRSRMPALAWITGAVAVAGFAGSATLGALAIARRDDGDDRSARRLARASDITLGGALCLAVTATITYFAGGRP